MMLCQRAGNPRPPQAATSSIRQVTRGRVAMLMARAGVPSTLRTLHAHLNQSTPRSVLLLEGLSDPTNVGTIIRNAAAFEVDLVIADPRGASPFSRRAARTSAGYIFSTPTVVAEPLSAIDMLKTQCPRLEILAATPHHESAALHQFCAPETWALLIGNEGYGLTEEATDMADHSVRIPMAPSVDSLNAAASTAILLYSLKFGVSC